MNLLAHAYLSFQEPEILVGNMISDFVKGKKQFDFPIGIQKGIQLHRAIDHFTDTHAATHAAKQVFKPAVGLYSGAFMDVVYDHFLAIDTQELSEENWQVYVTEVYQQLTQQTIMLPEQFSKILPYMCSQNWLFNYRFTWGIEKSFGGLVRRAQYLNDAAPAFSLFEENYALLQAAYNDFFPDVKKFAQNQLDVLLSQ